MKSQGYFSWKWIAIVVSVVFAGGIFALGVKEEVPLGTFFGTVRFAENNQPLPHARLVLRSLPATETEKQRAYYVRSDENGRFNFSRIPLGNYTIEAFTRAHSAKENLLSLTEGKQEIEVVLMPTAPFLEPVSAERVFTPDEQPSVTFDGFAPEDELKCEIYSIDLDAIVREGGLENVLWSVGRWGNQIANDHPSFKKVKEFSHKIQSRDYEGVFQESIQAGDLPQGFYWFQVKNGPAKEGTYFFITNTALLTKQSGENIYCYLTNVRTGDSVPNSDVYVHSKDQTKYAGKTDESGFIRVNAKQLFPDLSDSFNVSVSARSGDSVALVSFYMYSSEQKYRMFVYTDRPIYRPGDTIYFKGIARELQGLNYIVPANKNVTVEVRSPEYDVVKRMILTTNDMGSFSGEFSTSTEAITGAYEIYCEIDGVSESSYARVAAYRKPDYSVSIKPASDVFISGEDIVFTVSAEYYFGGPVVGANVSVNIFQDIYWAWDSEYEIDEEYYSAGNFITTIQGKTNADGSVTFRLNSSHLPQIERESWDMGEYDRMLTLSADVDDGSGRMFNSETNVVIARSAYEVKVAPQKYIVSPGEKLPVSVTAIDRKNKSPVSNLNLQVRTGTREWYGEGWKTYYLKTYNVKTDENGFANLEVDVSSVGSIFIEAQHSDARGNKTQDYGYVYVYAGGYDWSSGNYSDITITLDKEKYNVGETAQALIITNNPGAKAWVTIESTTLHQQKIIDLGNNATMFEFEVTPDLAPNAYITVNFVNDKTFYQGSKMIQCSDSESVLNVSIESDKQNYLPREEAAYTIKTTDESGNPVDAEISLSVVDESIYSLAKDRKDITKAFYPKRYQSVYTVHSLERIYFSSEEKSGSTPEIRRIFRDTAFWLPTIRTGGDGTATISVSMPDNVTSWRASVKAITASTKVGQNVQNIVVKKPFMLILQTPRFFTQGDETEIITQLHNTTDKKLQAEVSVSADGVEFLSSSQQKVHLEPNSTQNINWKIRTLRPGTLVLTALAKTDAGLSDGMELKIPVNPKGRPLIQTASGEVINKATANFDLDADYIKHAGGLKIKISPSLASVMLQSLDYLIGYPYGCTEQTLSRFLPTILVAQILQNQAIGLSDFPYSNELPKMIEAGFARLRKFQLSDGGWGWWEYGPMSAEMTALVLEGYWRASQAGFPPNQQSLASGVRALRSWVDNTPLSSSNKNDYLYALKALALYGDRQFVIEKFNKLDIDTSNLSETVIALQIVNALGAGFESDRDRLLNVLLSKVIETQSHAYWEEPMYSYHRFMVTASAFEAIASINPNHPILSKIIRYFIQKRRGFAWYSTRDSADILYALSTYAKSTGALSPNYNLKILINGEEYRNLQVTQPVRDMQVYEIPLENLKQGGNTLSFELQGQGRAYFDAELLQYTDKGTTLSTTTVSGFSIERSFHVIESRRFADGTMKLMPRDRSQTSFNKGDLIRVILKIRSDTPKRYILVESPFPSGCEMMETYRDESEYSWYFWYSGFDIKDDKIAYLIYDLPAGENKLEFTLRAERPGVYTASSARVSNMYDPEIRATTPLQTLQIK